MPTPQRRRTRERISSMLHGATGSGRHRLTHQLPRVARYLINIVEVSHRPPVSPACNSSRNNPRDIHSLHKALHLIASGNPSQHNHLKLLLLVVRLFTMQLPLRCRLTLQPRMLIAVRLDKAIRPCNSPRRMLRQLIGPLSSKLEILQPGSRSPLPLDRILRIRLTTGLGSLIFRQRGLLTHRDLDRTVTLSLQATCWALWVV